MEVLLKESQKIDQPKQEQIEREKHEKEKIVGEEAPVVTTISTIKVKESSNIEEIQHGNLQEESRSSLMDTLKSWESLTMDLDLKAVFPPLSVSYLLNSTQSNLYQNRIPSLRKKIVSLVENTVFSPDQRLVISGGLEALKSVQNEIVTRSASLREGKKPRAMKKKALVDLLRGLKKLGLSHHKSAVPKVILLFS